MFRHILLTSSIGNAQRTVRRICIFISRLKGLRKLNEMLRVALHWAEGFIIRGNFVLKTYKSQYCADNNLINIYKTDGQSNMSWQH